MNIGDLAITSLETITAFDPTTGDYKFTLDELQNATIGQTQEKTDILGKLGRKLNSLKKNKGVTISGTNGLVSNGLLEVQTGSGFENKLTTVMWTDYITVGKSNKANTKYKAVGTTGAEIESLYIKNEDGTLGTALTQGEVASAGVFKYTPGTKELQFHTDVAEGTEVVAYYKRQIQADVHTNHSDKYSEKATLYVDALAEDKCAKVYRVQFYIPKADFSGEFSFEIGDNQTVHAFEAEALAGACGTSGEFWTYTVFADDAADAEGE